MPRDTGILRDAEDEQDDVLDLGDLIPETKTVTVRRDGQRVRLEAYVYATAPVSAYALIAQAHDRYVEIIEDPATKAVHRDQAFCDYNKHVARALCAGLTYEEADNLAGDYPKLRRMLAALGYPPPRTENGQGEAPGVAGAPTTQTSSPDSEPVSAATTATG